MRNDELEAKHYDWVVCNEAGEKLAYKERGKEAVILKAEETIEILLKNIVELQNKLIKLTPINSSQTEIAKAVKTLTAALKEDPDFYMAYQANIAMAFQDEANNYTKEYNGNIRCFYYIDEEDIHELANKAAVHFLELWCRNVEEEPKQSNQ